jgi:hypothetical protein
LPDIFTAPCVCKDFHVTSPPVKNSFHFLHAWKSQNFHLVLQKIIITEYNQMEVKTNILFGDSKDILKELPDNSVDLIFTSPPLRRPAKKYVWRNSSG